MEERKKKKRIIIAHGLGQKVEPLTWFNLWKKCIIGNLAFTDALLAEKISSDTDIFRSAYWADAVPYHIPHPTDYCEELEHSINGMLGERNALGLNFHVGKGKHVLNFFATRGIDLVKIFSRALTIQDEVVKSYLEEVRLYHEDQFAASNIREPLTRELIDAWDSDADVCLITHSMGTFIAYDILWQFSHRNVDRYKQRKDNRIKMFITLGSPLAEPFISDILLARFHRNNGIARYPTNIDAWHNYACMGDIVAHQCDFETAFFKPMTEFDLFSTDKPDQTRNYVNLHNPFVSVKTDGNTDHERRNPHSSYGYLIQPKLAKWIVNFLQDDLSD